MSKIKSDRCNFCNSIFSNEILRKIKANKDNVYCESCGDLISLVHDKQIPTTHQNPPNIPFLTDKTLTEINIPRDALRYPNGRVYYDTDFPQIFKSNFVIVLARLIYFQFEKLKKEGYLNTEVFRKFENLVNEIHRRVSPIHEERIKAEFVGNLYEITLNEFELNLRKLQKKFKTNKKFREDFIIYTRTLIRRVLTIISERREIGELSKFEHIIIRDLAHFGFCKKIEDLKPLDIVRKTKTTMEKPAKIVNHYYEKLKKCRRNSGSTIRRHNYIIIGKRQISCVDCGHTILNTEIEESTIKLTKRQLKNLEKNKKAGDVSIYRISIKRIHKNGKLEWLPFPGLNYIGQTIYTGEERFKSHVSSALGNDKNITEFDQFILETTYNSLAQPSKKKAKSLIKKIYKVEILQIVRFQGDWDVIRNIFDQDELQKKIKRADNLTEQLANKVEKYWIGWYKTQYEEFGKNVEEGGTLRGSTAANLMDVDILFRQGYLPVQIGRKVGLQGNDDSIRKTITGYIKIRLYPNIFYPNGLDKPAISFRDGRRIIFKGIIDDLVEKGNRRYKDLIKLLPGFENPEANGKLKWHELKRITLQTHGGMKKLVDKHHQKDPNYYYKEALEIIKKNGRKYSDFDLAKDLGFIEDFKYTFDGLKKNAGRAIKDHIGKSIMELRDDAFPPKDITYYIPKAIELIRKNYRHGVQNGGYGAGKLAVDLEIPKQLGYSEKYIQDRGPKILKKVIKMTYNELVNLTFDK